jgi:tetratricopeptide (TPR) repeat protein
MNEITIPLETLATLGTLQGRPLARDVSPEMLCANIGSRYDFLPQPVEIRLADAIVTIRWANQPEEDQAEAARLFERAGRRAREGEYERVGALCRQALSLQPTLYEARRDLARAYLETGDRANAQAALWQALWLNPRDTWALVTLAGLLVEGGESDKAERLARMALNIEPANAEALDALGRAQLRAGHEQEALGAFGRALSLKPQLTAARLGSARALLRQDKPEEALAFLQEVFTEAGAAKRPTPAVTEARSLYAEAQEVLVRRDLDRMRQAVKDFRRRLEEQGALPIRFCEAQDVWASIEVAWTNNRDYHLLACTSRLPEPLRLHLTAHELMHLQTDLEAHRAGRLRAVGPVGCLSEFRGVFAGAAHDLRRRGFDPEKIEQAVDEALDFCQGAIHGNPLDIVVEARLRAELPILAPAQFLSDRHFLAMTDALDLNPMLRRVLPRPLLQGVEALIGAHYLLADQRHSGATDFAARYKTRPTFRLMEKLVTRWQARFPDLGPGGHFDLVDEFAAQLGMQGLCGWRYFPKARAPAAHTEAYAAVEPTKEPMPEPDNPVLGLP